MEVDKSPDPAYLSYRATYDRRLKMRTDNLDAIKTYYQKQDIVGKRISKINQYQKFASKLKTDNRNLEALIVEMQTLNLTKYLEEVATIIAETVTEKEVELLAEMSSKMMQDYESFSPQLIKELKKHFDQVLASEDMSIKYQLKAIIHLVTELSVCAFPLPYKDIGELIKSVFNAGVAPKEQLTGLELKEKKYCFNSDIYSMMMKQYGEVLCNRSSVKTKAWVQSGLETRKYPELLPVKDKLILTKFFQQYVREVSIVLKDSLKFIKDMQASLADQLKLTGEFNTETEKKYKTVCDRFLLTRTRLFEIADSIDEKVDVEGLSQSILEPAEIQKNILYQVEGGDVFEDQFQVQLYRNLLDIKEPEEKGEDDGTYEAFRSKLDSCNNIEQSDNLTREFLKINSRKSRKLLVRDLLQYRKKYQLVTPYLCRIAANLYQRWKDLADHINQQLFNDYDKLKDSTTNDPVIPDKRNRNLKYICEFTKFGVVDCEKTLACIKDLIEHLNGNNIELLVACLESVGRFLYINKASGPKFVFLLTQLRNVIKKKSFPVMVESQLEDCLSLLKPAVKEKTKRVKSDMEVNIIEILSRINEANINDIAAELKAVLDQPNSYDLVLNRILRKIIKHSYTCSFLFVVLVKRLGNDRLISDVCKQSQQHLFHSIKSELSQQSLEWARFQGQLYNYQFINKQQLYDMLYSILKIEDNYITVINSVCSMLSVSKQYLEVRRTASVNQRLRFFLTFKRYINSRKYIPMFTEFQLLDILEEMQPEVLKLTNHDIEGFLKAMEEKQLGRKKELNELEELKTFSQNKSEMPAKPDQIENPRTVLLQQQLPPRMTESKFDEQFNAVVSSQLKNLQGRIAKPKIIESFQRRKDKKKPAATESPNGTRTMRVIGKNGDKLIMREIKLRKQ